MKRDSMKYALTGMHTHRYIDTSLAQNTGHGLGHDLQNQRLSLTHKKFKQAAQTNLPSI